MQNELSTGTRTNEPASNERTPCPLCGSSNHSLVHRDTTRHYYQCLECSLIFVPPNERLDASQEKARYDFHQNDPDDSRYRKFLFPLAESVIKHTTVGALGLDFGCGPGPALAAMLRESGRAVELYDPYYQPNEHAWSQTYDFITASEVFEHLFNPRKELDRLFAALRPGGILAVMTRFAPAIAEFPSWYYIRDDTHVCFYNRDVFNFIAGRWQATISFPMDNIAIFVRR